MRYLSDKELSERYSVSRATIWRWVKEGHFPAPIKIAANSTRWKLSDIEQMEANYEQA